ncbi:MAG: DUF4410 domain-containing protein [Methylacidiphilales bacterium]|nr:DUF4410 domain-containing protein [Candidatus Methylacidiphilales bacterium]
MAPIVSVSAVCLALVLSFVGCASVSVKQGATYAVPQMPQQIFVEGFDTTQGEWNVDRQGPDLADFQQNLQTMLATGTASDLTNKLAPASITSSAQALPAQNAWVIRGEFVRVNQGSRALRAFVGFGAGRTTLQTVVHVYDLQAGYNGMPFMSFATTGGSGAMPGAVESIGPIGAVIKGVAGSAKGLTQDAARTSREITAQISEYMYKSGWITQAQYISPKTMGD